MESVFDKIAENRRVSELRFLAEERKRESEKELFRERLQFVQKQVQTRTDNDQQKFLERYVEENIEFLDSVIGYSVKTGRSSPYTDKTKEDIERTGGLILFYKKKAGSGTAWSFTDWQIGHGWLWLLQEIVKLYDLLSIDAAPKQNDAPSPVRTLSDKIRWKADPGTLRAHLAGLYDAGYITFDDIEAVLDGTGIPRTAKEPEDRTILYIFAVWWKLGCIDKSFFSSDGRDTKGIQYDEFIKGSFTHRSGKPFNNLSKAARPDKERKGFSRKGDTLEPLDKELYSALSSILK